ncbi:Protein of unknown function [Pyronema omphalodes CBS 100304]|uniref:Uncharacterized protein n=1 Tax=Pyronema omphalodes (strain CBS 100304) TaxID=1076935 RepID=U4LW12_PYROM|nr:Protein of unknown function [Pyronema omphalodes CBS 100304]
MLVMHPSCRAERCFTIGGTLCFFEIGILVASLVGALRDKELSTRRWVVLEFCPLLSFGAVFWCCLLVLSFCGCWWAPWAP